MKTAIDQIVDTMSTSKTTTVYIRPASPTDVAIQSVIGKRSRSYRSAYASSDRFRPTAYHTCLETGTGEEWFRNHYNSYSEEYVSSNKQHYGLRTPNVMFGGGYLSSSPTDSVFPSNPKLVNLLLENVKQQGVDMGGLLAELPETVSYLASMATSLVKFALYVKTGRLNKAAEMLLGKRRKKLLLARKGTIDTVASRWLEFNFAVKPLVSDIATLASLYDDPASVLKLFSCRARARTEGIFSDTSVDFTLTDSGYKGVTKHVCAVQDRMSVTYSVSDPELIARKALGLDSPPAAAWEGLPFSWLLDYAVNVGEFLGLLSADRGLNFIHGYRSIRGKYLAVGEYSLNRVISLNTQTGYIVYNYQRDFYSRRVELSFPAPQLRFVLPEITGRKVSYVAALVALLIKGK